MAILLSEALGADTTPSPILEDPGGPYLFCDLYPFDLDKASTPELDDPPWEKAFTNPHLFGTILKAWDGVNYGGAYADWFVRNFKKLTAMVGAARGWSRFFGGYLFAQAFQSPAAQAEAYLKVMLAAGWGALDIVPIVDVEEGGERAANRRASAQQWVDCVSTIVEWLKVRTGRGVMLYGRGAMREQSIGSKMGCDRVWDPAYTERIVTNGLVGVLPNGKPAPWTLIDVKLWQYGGDGVGVSNVHHLPLELVGFGKIDMSVFIAGSQRPTLKMVREGLIL